MQDLVLIIIWALGPDPAVFLLDVLLKSFISTPFHLNGCQGIKKTINVPGNKGKTFLCKFKMRCAALVFSVSDYEATI